MQEYNNGKEKGTKKQKEKKSNKQEADKQTK